MYYFSVWLFIFLASFKTFNFCSFADGGVFIQGYGALGIGPDNIEVKSATKVEFDQSHGKIAMISGSADYLAALTGK